MALTGREVINVQGVQANGQPSGVTEAVTIATLAQAPASNRGTVVVNGTTAVPVTYVAMTAGTVIAFSLNTVGGTRGATPVVSSLTPGVGFDVEATASDTSTYNWVAL